MFKDMAQRAVNAETNFVSVLMGISGCTEDQAYAVTAYYLKHKLAKLHIGIGTINVTHGIFLQADVIRRAVQETA